MSFSQNFALEFLCTDNIYQYSLNYFNCNLNVTFILILNLVKVDRTCQAPGAKQNQFFCVQKSVLKINKTFCIFVMLLSQIINMFV